MQRVQSSISDVKKKRMVKKSLETLSKRTAKSRLSKENKEVQDRLYFDERGLDKYYGLFRTWRDRWFYGRMLQVDMKLMERKYMVNRFLLIQMNTLHHVPTNASIR